MVQVQMRQLKYAQFVQYQLFHYCSKGKLTYFKICQPELFYRVGLFPLKNLDQLLQRFLAELTILEIDFPEMSLLRETLEEHCQPIISHFLVHNEFNNLKLWVTLGSDNQVPQILTLSQVQKFLFDLHSIFFYQIDEQWISIG